MHDLFFIFYTDQQNEVWRKSFSVGKNFLPIRGMVKIKDSLEKTGWASTKFGKLASKGYVRLHNENKADKKSKTLFCQRTLRVYHAGHI